MKTARCAISLAFVVALAVTQNVYGTIIVSHAGAIDPTTEGWTLQQRANGAAGPLASDPYGGGVAAWYTYDADSFADSAQAFYHGESALTSPALADIATGGWAMRANLRVLDMKTEGNEQPDQAPGLQVALAGSQQWAILKLGQDSSGNTTAQLSAGFNPSTGSFNDSSIITISGGGYHNYELRGRPTGSLVDLYVDGTKRVDGLSDANLDADFAGALGNRIYWGCADTAGVGIGYYNSVQFETAPVPEPSTLVLFGCCVVSLLAYAWRKHK